MLKFLTLGLAGFCCATFMTAATAQQSDLRAIDNPVPSENWDLFGADVAMSDANVLVGAPGTEQDGMPKVGAAYLFDVATASIGRALVNPDPTENDLFGVSVALTEDHALVGAYGDDPTDPWGFSGAAHLYSAETGDLLFSFTTPEHEGRSQFGSAVALSGLHALIGAPATPPYGHASLFDVATGAHVRTLDVPNAVEGGDFGKAVAISDRFAVVSSALTNQTGEVYVYSVGTGDLLFTITSPVPQSYEDFGRDLALSGDILLIGASGSAYVYELKRGSLLTTFVHPDAPDNAFFGSAVALNASHAIVGGLDVRAAQQIPQIAEAFVFDLRTGAVLDRRSIANDEYFGGYDISVAVSGNNFVAGLSGNDRSWKGAGSGYLAPLP